MYKLFPDKAIYFLNDEVKGILEFKIENGVANIFHTFVADELRGKGIADNLMRITYNYLNKKNYKIICDCSYAKKWIEKHGKENVNL